MEKYAINNCHLSLFWIYRRRNNHRDEENDERQESRQQRIDQRGKMTTIYKDIKFITPEFNRETHPVTLIYYCVNNDDETIGIAKWYERWNQYGYFDICSGIYTQRCLEDIADFINQLNKTKTKPIKGIK